MKNKEFHTYDEVLHAGIEFYYTYGRYPQVIDLKSKLGNPSARIVRAFFEDLDNYKIVIWQAIGSPGTKPERHNFMSKRKLERLEAAKHREVKVYTCLFCGANNRTKEERICPAHKYTKEWNYHGDWMNNTSVSDEYIDIIDYVFD